MRLLYYTTIIIVVVTIMILVVIVVFACLYLCICFLFMEALVLRPEVAPGLSTVSIPVDCWCSRKQKDRAAEVCLEMHRLFTRVCVCVLILTCILYTCIHVLIQMCIFVYI